MKNIAIPGSVSLAKPDNVPDDQHEPLQVVIIKPQHSSLKGFVMGWMPNKEDKEAIAAGKPILMKIAGPVLPFIELFTLDENDEPNS